MKKQYQSRKFCKDFEPSLLQEDEEGGEPDMEEDLYEKSQAEFFSIIEQEKKQIEKKKEAEMDKSDTGKVAVFVVL